MDDHDKGNQVDGSQVVLPVVSLAVMRSFVLVVLIEGVFALCVESYIEVILLELRQLEGTVAKHL